MIQKLELCSTANKTKTNSNLMLIFVSRSVPAVCVFFYLYPSPLYSLLQTNSNISITLKDPNSTVRFISVYFHAQCRNRVVLQMKWVPFWPKYIRNRLLVDTRRQQKKANVCSSLSGNLHALARNHTWFEGTEKIFPKRDLKYVYSLNFSYLGHI